jgi:hypothetical protein
MVPDLLFCAGWLIQSCAEADSSERGEQVAGVAESELQHGGSFLEESWLIDVDPKADGSKRGEQVAGVAEGELEHGLGSPVLHGLPNSESCQSRWWRARRRHTERSGR